VELLKLALVVFASRTCGDARVTRSAISMRHVWEDRASLCLLQTPLAAATGATSTLNALFMKRAQTITACAAKLVNVSIGARSILVGTTTNACSPKLALLVCAKLNRAVPTTNVDTQRCVMPLRTFAWTAPVG